MRWCVIAVTLAGCRGTVAPVASAPQVAPRAKLARVPVEIVPGELADPGVMDRITKRARIRVIGRAYLTLGGAAIDPSDREPPHAPLHVIAEMRDRLRVVSEDDGARVALWILRGDALPVPTVEVQLTDQRGAAPSDAGVWLEPGAAITVHRASDGRREVAMTTEMVNVIGWVPAGALGAVWTVVPPVTIPTTHVVTAGPLRAAPSADAAVIAATREDASVVAGETRGEWRMVELRRDGLRIRGWVPARALTAGAGEEWGTIGLGSVYTSSHTMKLDVPAGTCLFAGADGEVVGVTTRQKIRLGHVPQDGWQQVLVGTPWGTRYVHLHLTPAGAFESCLP
jgi:hypothetical protein